MPPGLLLSLPEEIIIEIISNISSPRDLLNFQITCKAIWKILTKPTYENSYWRVRSKLRWREITENTMGLSWKDYYRFRTSEVHWDPALVKHSHIALADHKKVVFSLNGAWNVARSNVTLTGGKWLIEFHVHMHNDKPKIRYWNIALGICGVNFDSFNDFVGNHPLGWCIVHTGNTYNNNTNLPPESDISIGDVIAIFVDMESSSLYYYINYNLCQKSVWVGIPNEVYLVGGVSGDQLAVKLNTSPDYSKYKLPTK